MESAMFSTLDMESLEVETLSYWPLSVSKVQIDSGSQSEAEVSVPGSGSGVGGVPFAPDLPAPMNAQDLGRSSPTSHTRRDRISSAATPLAIPASTTVATPLLPRSRPASRVD
uniref:Uncharacterized protein n=1 Tax=Leersia perrieri TaxID=77586 RepID=A0A0D9WLN3_9ORYZ